MEKYTDVEKDRKTEKQIERERGLAKLKDRISSSSTFSLSSERFFLLSSSLERKKSIKEFIEVNFTNPLA